MSVVRSVKPFVLLVGLGLCACKQSAPARVEPQAVRAMQPEPAQAENVSPAQRGVRDPFELDEESDDPAAALEAARHNCCDEMPAEELRQHTDDGAGQSPQP